MALRLRENIEAIVTGSLLISFLVFPGTLMGLGLGWLAGRVCPEENLNAKTARPAWLTDNNAQAMTGD